MAIATKPAGAAHPFVTRPHRTVLALSIPVLVSLVAEPLTGLVDTAFVARLGAEALAALGVGTAALSSIFWIFNFLGIGSQTEVAQALGQGRTERAARVAALAFIFSIVFGLVLIAIGWPLAGVISRALGATATVEQGAVAYMRWRLLGAPAVLVLLSAFGVLRGQQDMRTPLWIALGLNAVNIGLDALLITGVGPLPALGIAGAAMASAAAQWLGALAALWMVITRLGWPAHLRLAEASGLMRIGGDLFLRTGFLNLFILLATRVATQIGPESGAANQAIRQFWIFAALGLDALAITAQSLIGYFIGSGVVGQARRVAAVAGVWAVVLGVLLSGFMWFGRVWLAELLVPPAAWSVFFPAWLAAVLIQPINALAFVTDGIHWGTGDFRYLRNVVMLATVTGALGLALINTDAPHALTWVWVATNVWIGVRAFFGVVRVWPGIGHSPFRTSSPHVSLTSSP